MPYHTVQKLLFVKDYKKLEDQLKKISKSNELSLNNMFIETVEVKLSLLKSVKKLQTSRQSLEHFQQNVQSIQQNYRSLGNSQIKRLYLLGLSFFIFELTPKKEGSGQNIVNAHNYGQVRVGSMLSRESLNLEQKSLTKQLISLPTIVQYIADEKLIREIKSSLYLFMTLIELQTKKLIKSKRKQNKQQIYYLLKLIGQLSQNYPQTLQFIKKIQLILIHLRIYYLNSSIDISHNQAIDQMLTLILQQYDQSKSLVLSYQTIITLLYNTLKILLGIDTISQSTLALISKIFSHHNCLITNNYSEIIFRLFLIIKIIIFRQTQLSKKQISQVKVNVNFISQEQNYVNQNRKLNQCGNIGNNNKFNRANTQINDQEDHFGEIQGQDQILGETFSNFMNINLDTTVVQLQQVARNIIRHRVASLATLIGFKLGIQNLAIDFLQLMHDSPFNNDIQTIKLCFELFEARQFSKLEHLFQIVLSASTCKNLKERQVLIAMCSIFIGIYLENRQQGLLYAKLNHFQNKKHILREQTLLQHLGFSYFNLAKSQIYLENRQVYLVKALQNFKKSYQINPKNYVVTYCMSKVYLKLYDLENAYKYAYESCTCGRGRWVPFALLACIYMVQRKIHNSVKVMDQLIKKYPQQAILYYIRAYIQTNKILLQVQHDEEVEASKTMDQQIYQLTKDRILKGKSLVSLISYCQQFFNRVRSQTKQLDQNFFNLAVNFTQDSHEIQQQNVDGNADRKALLMIISLFIQVQQLQTAEGLLKTIAQSQHTSQSKHYHALIHLKRKQYSTALSDYKKILQKDNMHVDSLIQCSLLQKNQADALNYITLAGKFSNESKFWFAKGMVLSRLQRYQEAHQCFIKQADLGWIEELPQKLYYY